MGRALLREVLARSDERMTFSSGDPRALALYIRAGMRPWWPLLYVEVDASQLGGDDPGVEIVPSDVAENNRLVTNVDRRGPFEGLRPLRVAPGSGRLRRPRRWGRCRRRLGTARTPAVGRSVARSRVARPGCRSGPGGVGDAARRGCGRPTDRAHPRAASGHPGAAGTGRPDPRSGHVLCHEPRPRLTQYGSCRIRPSSSRDKERRRPGSDPRRRRPVFEEEAGYSAATATGFSIGTPMRLPYSVHEPS